MFKLFITKFLHTNVHNNSQTIYVQKIIVHSTCTLFAGKLEPQKLLNGKTVSGWGYNYVFVFNNFLPMR